MFDSKFTYNSKINHARATLQVTVISHPIAGLHADRIAEDHNAIGFGSRQTKGLRIPDSTLTDAWLPAAVVIKKPR